MKRLETETYEDYKLRRREENKLERIRRKGCFIWQPGIDGTRVGKFKDKESYILNDKYNLDTIKESLKEKENVEDKELIEETSIQNETEKIDEISNEFDKTTIVENNSKKDLTNEN